MNMYPQPERYSSGVVNSEALQSPESTPNGYEITICKPVHPEYDHAIQGPYTSPKVCEVYYAGVIVSCGGNSVGVALPFPLGVHDFDRTTGKWLSGPCANLIGARVINEDMEKILPAPMRAAGSGRL